MSCRRLDVRPVRCPTNQAGVHRSPRLDDGGSADLDEDDGHMASGVYSVTDKALTWEGDVAVRPLELRG